MADKMKFLKTFRARLLLLLTAFLLLTIVAFLILDNWARKRVEAIIAQQNQQINSAVNRGYGDLAQAMSLATQSLDSETYLFKAIEPVGLPATIEYIVVAKQSGEVVDSTIPDLVGERVPVPFEERLQVLAEDPIHKESEAHGHAPKTYYHPIQTAKGLYWIIIVTTQESIINEIEDASMTLANRHRDLSNYRLIATAGLLVLGLAVVVVIGMRFIRPIVKLASAARKVASGSLDFHVQVNRKDEIGQLASTFNEMIDGLRKNRELKEQLNQAERAAVIGRLTASVAHEVRNPLNVINLSIDHVSTKYAPADEKQRAQFMEILSSIKDEIARLKSMVSDLLNLGRPSYLALNPVDLRELVEETMTLVRQQADAQGVQIVVNGDGRCGEVMGDRERLKSCLSNIVINALQAMPKGGSLRASVKRSDEIVEVRISDSGIGISEAAIEQIFNAYFSTRESGFGLGLAVTKSIIEDHHGTIQVESQVNEGTTFTVRLPAHEDSMKPILKSFDQAVG